MTRLFLSICLAALLLMLLPALDAFAVEMPIRKAGLWQMKILKTGSSMPEMTMQHCTDESTDKEMSTTFSPMVPEMKMNGMSARDSRAIASALGPLNCGMEKSEMTR